MTKSKDDFIKAITNTPLDADIHLQYAMFLTEINNHYLAFAELKTASYLGADENNLSSLFETARNNIPDPSFLNHNLFYRISTLSKEISDISKNKDMSVLDIGGGEGILASFVPNANYCLAEPRVNGIDGINLPFENKSFDIVVACHVLEHVPIDQRTAFLNQLVSKSNKSVILLNPFEVQNTFVTERLKLLIQITDAWWAKEHLECSLPKLDDIVTYANNHGLKISIKPNGTMTTGFALTFMDYFAGKAGLKNEAKMINKFFNDHYMNLMDSNDYPIGYFIHLEKT